MDEVVWAVLPGSSEEDCSGPYYLWHLFLFFISKSLVAVILERVILSSLSIDVQTPFEEISGILPTNKALGAGKCAGARPPEELGPQEK